MKRTWPWIVLAVAFVAWFVYFETEAFIHPDEYMTLSMFVASIGAKWPFFIFLCGGATVGLAVHFFWAWPSNPNNGGG